MRRAKLNTLVMRSESLRAAALGPALPLLVVSLAASLGFASVRMTGLLVVVIGAICTALLAMRLLRSFSASEHSHVSGLANTPFSRDLAKLCSSWEASRPSFESSAGVAAHQSATWCSPSSQQAGLASG